MVGINMEMPNNCYDCYRNMYCIVGIDGGWRLDKRVEGCPLVEIEERKVGKWIIDDEEHGRIWHCHCSNCKKDPQDYIGGSENWWLVRLPDYCPCCGAEMRGAENELD